jgi:hypothetical protein
VPTLRENDDRGVAILDLSQTWNCKDSMTNPKGARFERLMADYLGGYLSDIDRQVKTGAKDKGDIRGVRIHNQPVAVECKNTAKPVTGQALSEVEKERVNLGALAGVVVSKRHGKGKPEDQLVYMTARDFVAILTGVRQ